MGYPTKLQCIRRQNSHQFYVNFPLPMAQALDFQPGEQLEWTIADKGHFILSRQSVPPDPVPLKKKTSLLHRLTALLDRALAATPQPARHAAHALAQLVTLGRHTLTGLLTAQHRQHQDWTADHRFYSQGRAQPQALFTTARQHVEAALPPTAPLVVALDDSLFHKTGRRIPGTAWRRDPLGPPFQVQFTWAQRVLQVSAARPLGPEGAARMVPIDFVHAHTPAKPRKGADAPAQAAYAAAAKEANLVALAPDTKPEKLLPQLPGTLFYAIN
jgi:hypothetical protein